jgi:hypothetical protein
VQDRPLAGFKFGLTYRQARSTVRKVMACCDSSGNAVRRGERQSEDIGLAYQRLSYEFSRAWSKGDYRLAFRVEKSLCRFVGLYARDRQTWEERQAQERNRIKNQNEILKDTNNRRALRFAHQRECGTLTDPDTLDDSAPRKSRIEQLAFWAGDGGPERCPPKKFQRRVTLLVRSDGAAQLRDAAMAIYPPRPRRVEERLDVLSGWLEAGIPREQCEENYRRRFKLSPRVARRDMQCALWRLQHLGFAVRRHHMTSTELTLSLLRRDRMLAACRKNGDHKLAVEIELDRIRLLGLMPADRQPDPPSTVEEWRRDKEKIADQLDPSGRGTGLPTRQDLELLKSPLPLEEG